MWGEDGRGEFLLRDSLTGEWINTLGREVAIRRAEASRADLAEAEVLRLRQRLQELGHADESHG